MTAPPTPEALVEALNAAIELQRCLAPLDQVHWSAEEPSVCLRLFRETETQAVIDLMKAVRGFEDTVSLAPLLAALQQVTAERDEAREVVARCNNSFGSYSYHLNPHPAEQIEKVKWQARSEWQRAEAANAEAARLRAEVAARQAEDEALMMSNDGELEADPQKQIAHLQLSCREFIREREEWKASAKREWAEVDRLRAEVEALKGSASSYSAALAAMKLGASCRRQAWKAGKSVRIMVPQAPALSYLALVYDDGRQAPWTPTRCDQLEDDWLITRPEQGVANV